MIPLWALISGIPLVLASSTGAQPIAQFLAFGDSGYHYDYPSPRDVRGAATFEEFIEEQRRRWQADKLPPDEFKPGPAYQRPGNGTWIPASGQTAVAHAMRNYCAGGAGCKFAVMLGDNIYPKGATVGKDGRDDTERFQKILYGPYAPFAALYRKFRFYVALGNHDWHASREGAMAQVRYHERTRPFYMKGIRYSVAPTGDPREVELFVLDTQVLLSGVAVLNDKLDDDGSEVETEEIDPPSTQSQPKTAAERDMAKWLERSLARSKARWKVVIGHHPLWSSTGSNFQQARALRALILPTLCRHADMYLAGHEHTLEVHTDACKDVPPAKDRPPLLEVVSGAASKQRSLNTAFERHQIEANPELTSIWTRGLVWGFAHVTLAADTATIRIVSTPDDGSGTPVLEFEHRFDRRSGR